MNEFSNLKIDDVYVFYFSSGYVNCNSEDEMTIGEITGAENQEQLDKLKPDYIDECFQESYNDFLMNQDSGWYKKES